MRFSPFRALVLCCLLSSLGFSAPPKVVLAFQATGCPEDPKTLEGNAGSSLRDRIQAVRAKRTAAANSSGFTKKLHGKLARYGFQELETRDFPHGLGFRACDPRGACYLSGLLEDYSGKLFFGTVRTTGPLTDYEMPEPCAPVPLTTRPSLVGKSYQQGQYFGPTDSTGKPDGFGFYQSDDKTGWYVGQFRAGRLDGWGATRRRKTFSPLRSTGSDKGSVYWIGKHKEDRPVEVRFLVCPPKKSMAFRNGFKAPGSGIRHWMGAITHLPRRGFVPTGPGLGFGTEGPYAGVTSGGDWTIKSRYSVRSTIEQSPVVALANDISGHLTTYFTATPSNRRMADTVKFVRTIYGSQARKNREAGYALKSKEYAAHMRADAKFRRDLSRPKRVLAKKPRAPTASTTPSSYQAPTVYRPTTTRTYKTSRDFDREARTRRINERARDWTTWRLNR